MLVRIDHWASECTLIKHDLDNIQSRLTLAADCISEVEDATHSHGSQLSELQGLVRSLQNRADDAEDRQRRNNVRVVGLPEGAEGAKPIISAKQFFEQLLLLEDLPPTYMVKRAHSIPTGNGPPGASTPTPAAFPSLFFKLQGQDYG